VTVIDLSVSLVGVLIALPAALVLAGAPERGGHEGREQLPVGDRPARRSLAATMRRRGRGRAGHETV
jgi:hypothetical protein